jgi:hypothetical protein
MNMHRSLRGAVAALLIAFTISIGFTSSYGMREKPARQKTQIDKERKWPNFRNRDYPMVVNEKKEMRQQSAEFTKKKNYLRTYERTIKKNDRSSLRDPWAGPRKRSRE